MGTWAQFSPCALLWVSASTYVRINMYETPFIRTWLYAPFQIEASKELRLLLTSNVIFSVVFMLCKNERAVILNSQFCNSGFSHSSLNCLYRCQNCIHQLSQVSSSWRIFSLLTQKKSGHCHAVSIDSWTRGTHFENLLLWTSPTTRLLFTEVRKAAMTFERRVLQYYWLIRAHPGHPSFALVVTLRLLCWRCWVLLSVV